MGLLPEVKVFGGTQVVAVGFDPITRKMYPLPIDSASGQIIVGPSASPSLESVLQQQDFASWLSLTGRAFSASAAAVNTAVTGQTSFANTTPTFLLSVPSGTTAIPLLAALTQTSPVAGGDIHILMEKDNVDRFSSGGTAATVFNDRSGSNRTPNCTLRTGATASNAYGVRMGGWDLAADISPAEGVINELVWTPASRLDWIDGPGSWLVYTYAGTTGPTWWWEFGWGEIPTADLPSAQV